MGRRLFVIVAMLGAVAAAPGGTRATSSNMAVRANEQGAILYQASFKTKGLRGWTQHVPPGDTSSWHVNRQGILVFSGEAGSQAEMQAPFSVARLSNFAVQAQIKVVGQPSDPFYGFGVVVRNADQPSAFTTGSNATGVLGGYYSLPALAELVWYPDEVGGAAATLSPGYNTFRVEVHRNDYSLLINGRLIVRFPITPSKEGAHIGLWAHSQKVRVKSFQVFRLSSAPPLPAVPSIKALALSPTDVPSGFRLAGRADYITVAEQARFDKVSAEEEAGRGFVLGYAASYLTPVLPNTGVYLADTEVLEYTSAPNAHAHWSLDWANTPTNVQTGDPTATHYASGDVSGVGDEAHWVSYDSTETYYGPSFKVTQLGILFRRGPFEGFVNGGFVQGTVSHDEMLKEVTAWAKVVDGRIQTARASS